MNSNLESETTPPPPHTNYETNYNYASSSEYENPEPASVEYASFLRRFAASFIDGLIIMGAGFVIIGTLSLFGLASFADEDTSSAIATQIEGLLIGWLYEAVMTSSHRQGTFGKIALGIKVTDMRGNRLTFARASGRHFAKLLSSIICLIGYLVALFTAKTQALHDLLAETVVVKKA